MYNNCFSPIVLGDADVLVAFARHVSGPFQYVVSIVLVSLSFIPITMNADGNVTSNELSTTISSSFTFVIRPHILSLPLSFITIDKRSGLLAIIRVITILSVGQQHWFESQLFTSTK
jgi:hypothetical protein